MADDPLKGVVRGTGLALKHLRPYPFCNEIISAVKQAWISNKIYVYFKTNFKLPNDPGIEIYVRDGCVVVYFSFLFSS